MGSFYTNYTLLGPDQQSVAAALAGRSAIVTPPQNGCVVVFDEESEGQNHEIIGELASRLSGKLNCPLLVVLNHDDDILWYQLYLNGELTDEYDSAPGYFETHDEEAAMAGPEGGDAAKLCAAFGSNAVTEVEAILMKSMADDDCYAFAMERHGDLVGALGIASYGVSAGFKYISGGESGGELPEELNEQDLVKTKELVAAPPPVGNAPKPVPGYYKVSFRAHPKLTESIPTSWMPSTWAELERPESGLSKEFHKATAPHREKFKRLGFVEQGFKKLTHILNPNARDMGGINYLDGSRCYYGQILYHRAYMPAQQAETEGIVIAFTAVFPNEVFSCTNHFDFLGPVPNQNVIRLKSDDAGVIYEQFISHLKQRTDSPRPFPDLASLQAWFDTNAFNMFEYRVRQGAWVRMSDFEVEKARRKLK